MNSVFSNFDDNIDTNMVFMQLSKLMPKVKKIESVTVLKEFTELAYKDDEMGVKFEFIIPHTVKMSYHGNEWVSIDDEEFDIYAGEKTEEDAILDYICHLDFLWDRYATGKVTNIVESLKARIETIKLKVKKIW